MNHCYTCIHWLQTAAFKGRCAIHPWEKDKYSQNATPSSMGCHDYSDARERLALVKER